MRTLEGICRPVTWVGIVVVGCVVTLPPLSANPKGGQVTAGNITINGGAGVTTITQTSPRGIIHWQDFSIGAGELTQFIHPDAKSATLNRVVGGIPTSIQGTLQANGQVYIVNPNGILIGPGGRINTAAFVASTLDVPDAQFMAGGDMHFSGNSLQGVVNLGSITATDGDVILMGHYVQNAGTISAPNGIAALAAGDDILLQAAGDERVVVNSGISTGGTGVENSGRIEAARAELKAAGGNVYALAINNTGIVKATGIAQTDGRIILSSNGGVVQNSGQLIAKSADGSGGRVKLDSGKGGTTTNDGTIDASADNPKKNGGTVELLGDTVNVGGNSVINVNGANGGTVAIGVSADLANQTTATGGIATITSTASTDPGAPTLAQQTTIQANSRIMANSTNGGNGGRVVVWSENKSTVGGVIEAKGGDSGGNGGLVETSGHTGLTIIPGTQVSTAAPKGKAGTWLLDPAGISVDASTTDADVTNYSGPTATTYSQNAATNHVLASDIVTALSAGNVTVQTTGFPSNADIVVNAAISIPTALGGNHLLSFISAGGIDVNAAIGGASSDVILQMQTHGDVNINSGGAIQMNGVSIFAITGSINIADHVTALNTNNALNDHNIFLNAPNGSIAFSGSGLAIAATGGTVYLDTHSSTTGTITSGATSAVSAGKLDIWAGTKGVGTSGSPFVAAVDNFISTVNSNSQSTGGGVFLKNTSGGTLRIGGVTPLFGQFAGGVLVPVLAGYGGAEINNTAGGILMDSTTGERIATAGNIKLTAGGASSDIRLLNTGSSSINSHFGSVTLNAGRNVQIGDAATNIWGVWVTGQTNVDVQAGGDVTVAGSELKAGGTSGLSVTAGGDVNMVLSNTLWSVVGTSGNVPINITTGAGKTFNLNTGSQGGLLTNLADNISGTLATGANIFINADNVVINGPIKAGNSSVGIGPVTGTRNMDISHVKDSSNLSFTPAELNNISAGTQLTLGTFTGSGSFGINDSIFSPSSYHNLLITTGGAGNVSVGQPITMPSGTLTLQAGSSGSITLSDTVVAGDLNLYAGVNIGATSALSKVSTSHLTFNANGNVVLTNASNNVVAINADSSGVSGAAQINLNTSSNLVVNGQLGYGGGTTTSILLQPGGNLTLSPGAQIVANIIGLNIGGSLINNSGQPGDAALFSSRYRVWESNFYAAGRNPGNLFGSNYTSAAVTFPSDPLGAGNVFYFANIAPPAPPINQTSLPLTLPKDFVLKLPTKYSQALLAPNPAAELRKLSLDDILGLETLVGLKNDQTSAGALGRAILQALGLGDLTDLVEQIAKEKMAAENQRLAQEARDAEAKAHQAWEDSTLRKLDAIYPSDLFALADDPDVKADFKVYMRVLDALNAYHQKQLNALAGVLGYNFPPEWYAVAKGPMSSALSIYSLTVEQIAMLSKDQVLRLLAVNGFDLSVIDPLRGTPNNIYTRLGNVGFSEHELEGILKNGPVTLSTFVAIVAAGGGNLSASDFTKAVSNVVSQGGGNVVSQGGGNVVSQSGGNVVSQGGGNVVSQGGGNVVSQGGGNLLQALAGVVSQGGGNVVSQGGGNLVDALTRAVSQVVSQGGGNVVSQGGGNVVSQGGGNVVSQGGGNVVSQGGGNVVSQGGGNVVSQGGGNVLGTISAALRTASAPVVSQGGGNLVGPGGSSLVGSGGSSAISNNGSSAISNNGSSAISNNGSSAISNNGSSAISNNGSSAISNNGSSLINTNGSNLIQLQSGAGAVSSLIKQ